MPRTFRELVWAYRGHEYAEWERLSWLLAKIHNVNRGSQHERVARPTDFFRRPAKRTEPRGTRLDAAGFRALRNLFVKKRDA